MTESTAPRPVAFRLGLYDAIRRTAEAQRQAVLTDDLDHFYDLLVEREKLLDKTEAVDQELEGPDRAHATELLQSIMRIDQETERLLMSKIDDARGELGGLAVGKQALKAYGFLG